MTLSVSDDDGHVFVTRADITHLACDDVVIPTGHDLEIRSHWRDALPARFRDGVVLADLGLSRVLWGTRRYAELPGTGVDGPRVWLIDTGGEGTRPISWYTDVLRDVLLAIHARDDVPRHRRARRLVALPLIGVGEGGASARRGDVIEAVLRLLDERAAAGQDCALVLRAERDHAAVQHVRRAARTTASSLHDEEQETLAGDLARRARAGELALFLGAGVSTSAGLPSWKELLSALLDRTTLAADERTAVLDLDARDAATIVVQELEANRTSLLTALREVLPQWRYGLAHALLASLPVEQAATTNYDTLFESARADQDRPTAVLPFDDPSLPWLLKLHGDLHHGTGVVLTRDDYLRFGGTSGALGGVVQGMLMTRHVLFAGFSFTDENFFRLAHGARRALESAGRKPRAFGTALELHGNPLRRRLWAGELDYVAFAQEASTSLATAARRLEIFFDRVACLAADDASYLLDPAYSSLMSESDRALASALGALDGVARGDGAGVSEVRELLQRLGRREG
ncbi:SIR2 family protein [Actinomycetospora sp. CA-101289]|uniref:SIR2 family protein n=1 Tax=Actinomycetospora sp. CA-101289 TaxID=3239893 RepID=UPI003D95B7A4